MILSKTEFGLGNTWMLKIELLTEEWERPGGFLGDLRPGVSDYEGLERLISVFESIRIENAEYLNRRFVSLIWFIPLFMEWQKEKIAAANGNTEFLQTAINRVVPLVNKILGLP